MTATLEISPHVGPAGTGRIRVLPESLVKKIAAGEVVERPASVIKELVENSIDAGATRIAIAIEDGGRRLIQVADDGCGMSEEDLRLAILPHATSKIVGEDDLFAISTLGFRGEALASISAVSRLSIISRPAGSDEGFEIRAEGDRIEQGRAAARPPGTTIEVRDLFFNVPARRKFLRAASTEVGHINEQVCRLALAHPHLGFDLVNQQRTTQAMPAGESRVQRIARYYGAELSAALLHVERNERGVHIEAFVAPPAHSRATAQWQYAFLNGRFIRDRYLQHAIKESYRGLMEPQRHAVVFLFLTVDPREVDVNVHPTKMEVRWADSNLIHSQVLSALRETLQRGELRPGLRTERAVPAVDPAEQERVRREWAAELKAAAPIVPGDPRGAQRAERSFDLTPPSADPLAAWRALYGPTEERSTPGLREVEAGPLNSTASQSPSPHAAAAPPTPLRAMQMHDLYLVVEEDDGIMIVDQHALHERVMYDEFRRRLAEGPLQAQRLLLSETLHVNPRQMALLEAHADLLARLGIEVTQFGTDTVAVHAFPVLLKDAPVAPFMRDLLDRLEHAPEATENGNGAGAPTAEVLLHRILDMMACKAAVKAGDRLNPEEIAALIAKRHLVEKASSCPHGRPTMLRLTRADLDRQFKRT